MKIALLAALAIGAAGCRAEIPDSVKGASDEAQLRQRVIDYCRDNPEPGCESQLNTLWCEQQGGQRAQFTNGCQDLCGPQQITAAGGSVICTSDTPRGCACPGELCWDGIACVPLAPIESAFDYTGPLWPAGCAAPSASAAKVKGDARRALVADNTQCLQGWIEDAVVGIEGMATANLGASIALGCLDQQRRLSRRLDDKLSAPPVDADEAAELTWIEGLERRVEEIGQGANACLSREAQ